jgi:chitinase
VAHFAASTDGRGNVLNYYLTTDDQNDPTSIANFVGAGHAAARSVLVSIKDNDNDYSLFPASASSANIDRFVGNIVAFVTTHGYDGVDLDWEKNVNATQYQQLILKLRQALPAGKLITMAVNPGGANVAAWANPANGSRRLVDQVNVMCYDLDWGNNFSWFVGPLLRGGNNRVLACDWDIKQFTNAGVAKNTLGLGMPFYGRRWPGVNQPLKHASFNKAITFTYRCLVNDSRWQRGVHVYDTRYKANYLSLTNPLEFDSYTGPEYIADAVAWGKSQGLGGYMTYNLEYEFLGAPYANEQCPTASYSFPDTSPLSTALHSAVFGF